MRRAWLACACVLALAGCGDEEPAPVVQNFAPLHYEYLPKIRLNVGSVQVVDHSVPVSPEDVAATSPAVPAQALAQMARDRLFPAGTSGTANFVIDQASIVRQPSGVLDGQMDIHLDLLGANGQRGGYAEARVAREHVPGSDPEDPSTTLYLLTKQMMEAMNVELEYQIRHSLQAWIVPAGSVPAPVVAQPLGGAEPAAPAAPPLPPAAPDVPQAGEPPAEPPAPNPPPDESYQDPTAPTPQQMSPPPGYLQPPPGATPVLPQGNAY